MKILKDKNVNELFKLTANIIFDDINELAKKQDKIVIGLVGGRSVVSLYKELSKKDSPTWKKCHFFMIDERYVPIDNSESNYKLAKDTLLNPLLERNQIQEEYIHPLRTELSGKEAAEDYSNQFNEFASKFDIAILSSGEDGHIAAIYPNKECNYVDTFEYIEDSPKPPSKRITATSKTLRSASKAYVLFLGEGKHEALKKFLNNKTNLNCPEETLRAINDLTIITDQIGVK